ncbi:MAG: phytanoyl-CoA dioxygenase family protein [Bacteroidetes bacterium]|nr:phytanoyl-CoA dioxygenase family protein [Bacteroidota bacterium]
MQTHFSAFKNAGFAIINPCVSEPLTNALAACIPCQPVYNSSVRGVQQVFAIRKLLHTVPALKPVLIEAGIASLAQDYFKDDVKVIRSIYFNKPDGANWIVPWHQDLTVNLTERHETPGFTGWAEKEGQITAKAPASLLSRILTIRIHLDDCDAENGALKVIPGSHLNGEYRPEQTGNDFYRNAVCCNVPKGGVMLMHPLLLHSSARS